MNYENHPAYRLLEQGERIETGDQAYTWLDPECTRLGWADVAEYDAVGRTVDEHHVPVRRPLPMEGRWVGAVTESHGLARGYFRYSDGGGFDGEHRYTPPFGFAKDQRRLFVVRVCSEGWIPANLLVWALDEHHAVERVMDGYEVCNGRDTYRSMYHKEGRGARILRELESGELEVQVQPIDWRVILHVQWADNTGL
jgi:hypothetical protein